MIFSKMSKNSAADCPRLYVRSSQQLREFKVSNELLTHRVVITLSCSSHIVTFAIHTFNLHKILCLCCFAPISELGAKIRQFYGVEKKLLSLRFSSFFLFSCLVALSCYIVLSHCLVTHHLHLICTSLPPHRSLSCIPLTISAVNSWS